MHHPTRHPSRLRTATFSAPEALEYRIAPAAVVPEFSNGGKTATWIDVDGDVVTLTISKGSLEAANFDLESRPGGGAILERLDLTAEEFKGASVTIKAVRDSELGGDNSVNIGFIDATENTLGKIKIAGDLAQISAGKTALTAKTSTAIKSLNVKSMGMLGDSTLNEPGALISTISGKLGSLTVAGSVTGVSINVLGGTLGSIGSVKIGGSLVGTDLADSGQIVTSGNIGAIAIGGNVEGGTGQRSGMIDAGGNISSISVSGSIFGGKSEVPGTDNTGVVHADGTIGSVKIDGSIVGGTQQNSGVLSAGSDIGKIQVAGSVFGGKAGITSGAIVVGGSVKALTVNGDVVGNGADESGYIAISGSAAKLTVKGSLQGGSALKSGFIQLGTDATDVAGTVSIGRDLIGDAGEQSGVIASSAAIKKLSVSGSIYGGSGNTSGAIQSTAAITSLSVGGNIIGGDLALAATSSLTQSGYIEASSITNLTISGSISTGSNYAADPTLELVNNASIRVANNIGKLTILGNIEGDAETAVVITARGAASVPVNATKDIAFGSVSVGGSVRYTEILAGYNLTDDVSAAAINPNAQIGSVTVKKDWIASNLVAGAAYNETFGDGTDTLSPGVENPDIIAKIAKITIGGQVFGTAGVTTDHFGFVAEEIGKFQLGKGKAGAFSLSSGESNDNDPVLPRYNVGGTDDTRIFEFA